jgi:hypothetical protein
MLCTRTYLQQWLMNINCLTCMLIPAWPKYINELHNTKLISRSTKDIDIEAHYLVRMYMYTSLQDAYHHLIFSLVQTSDDLQFYKPFDLQFGINTWPSARLQHVTMSIISHLCATQPTLLLLWLHTHLLVIQCDVTIHKSTQFHPPYKDM